MRNCFNLSCEICMISPLVPLWFQITACNMQLTIGIGQMTYVKELIQTKWELTAQRALHLGNGVWTVIQNLSQITATHLHIANLDMLSLVKSYSTMLTDCPLAYTQKSLKMILNYFMMPYGVTRPQWVKDHLGANITYSIATLKWRHNERHGVSNHRCLHCLFNYWMRPRSKKTSKFHLKMSSWISLPGTSTQTCGYRKRYWIWDWISSFIHRK